MLSQMTKDEVIEEYIELRKLVVELLCVIEDIKDRIDKLIVEELE